MPADLEKINRYKEKIISLLKLKGPSLPVQIARTIEQSLLFTSAFLSELMHENKLKMSNLKIGSSSLYLLQGQEAMLENFLEHLNNREKQAHALLKESQILDDDSQEPVIRVALRAIKDFAIPIHAKINEQQKVFWKYFQLSDSEAKDMVQQQINPTPPQVQQATLQTIPQVQQAILVQQDTPKTPEVQENIKPAEPKEKPKKKKQEESRFVKNLRDYLLAKDIEILSPVSEKKKEFVSKVRIDTLFGKQEFYLIAKDKKKINETDLTLALQKAQNEKMPALIISPGEIDKKSESYLKDWKNLIKFEKVKL